MKQNLFSKSAVCLILVTGQLLFGAISKAQESKQNSTLDNAMQIREVPKVNFSQQTLIDAKNSADARNAAIIEKLIQDNPKIEALRIDAKNGKSVFIIRNGSKIVLSPEMKALISIDSGGWQPEELSGNGIGKRAIANLMTELSRTSQCNLETMSAYIAKMSCGTDMLVSAEELGPEVSQCLSK